VSPAADATNDPKGVGSEYLLFSSFVFPLLVTFPIGQMRQVRFSSHLQVFCDPVQRHRRFLSQ
jgi:hypothetical protein